jgi:phage FluMu gp28-like protein
MVRAATVQESAKNLAEIPARDVKRYFMKHQVETIMHDAPLFIWEKSVRIGATYGMAFRAVRRRMIGSRNYLHTSVNQTIAKDFAAQCKIFCRVFDVAGASDVEEFDCWNADENRRETGFEITFKRQANSIRVYSSNPEAFRGAGGEMGVDEICSHKNPEALMAAAGSRTLWGDPLNVWSSHKGLGSWMNRTIERERALGAKSRWAIKRTTMLDALDNGLLQKICEVTGTKITREDFIADTIAKVGGQEAYEEECLCKPRAAGDAAINWAFITAAREDYPIRRTRLEGNERFDVDSWIAPDVESLKGARKVAIGYDVARTGHLSAVAILALRGKGRGGVGARDPRGDLGSWWLHGLVTMHGRKFGLQREVLHGLLKAVPSAVGSGDATGLGMQVCEELVGLVGQARWGAVNFGATKPEIGTRLVRVFEDGRLVLPSAQEHEDIQFDLHGIRTEPMPGNRIRYYESANPVNKLSHCDIAWAIGLAVLAGGDENMQPGIITL